MGGAIAGLFVFGATVRGRTVLPAVGWAAAAAGLVGMVLAERNAAGVSLAALLSSDRGEILIARAADLDLIQEEMGIWHGEGTTLSLPGTWRIGVLVQQPADSVEVPLELEVQEMMGEEGPPHTSDGHAGGGRAAREAASSALSTDTRSGGQ